MSRDAGKPNMHGKIMRRRRVFKRLDQLVIGAVPSKLGQQTEIPAASPRPAVPLSDKERSRLNQLNTQHMYHGPLSPAEAYERQKLLARRQS